MLSLWRAHRYEIVRDLVVSLLAVWIAFQFDSSLADRQESSDDRRTKEQERLEDRRALQQDVLENLRFVRDRSDDPAQYKPFANMQLSGANLSGLELGCQPPDVRPDYNCANLTGADLSGALLIGTTLTDASLTNADLTSSQLIDANLTRAGLNQADASDADLYGAQLGRANLFRTKLAGANLIYASAQDAHFGDAILTGANLAGANLTNAQFAEADLTGANLVAADLTGAALKSVYSELSGKFLDPPTLTDIFYDERTVWPEGFKPPPLERDCSEERNLPPRVSPAHD